MIKLPELKELQELSLDKFFKYLEVVPSHFTGEPGKEPYKLLAWLSLHYKNIADLGTYEGLSALALSNNHLAKVTSYDITQSSCKVKNRKNITFVEGDLFDHIDSILESDLISLDIDPHDGIQEAKFTDILIEKKWKGVLIADDIHLKRYLQMTEWWRALEGKEKLDVTYLGHHSGTGIIKFI